MPVRSKLPVGPAALPSISLARGPGRKVLPVRLRLVIPAAIAAAATYAALVRDDETRGKQGVAVTTAPAAGPIIAAPGHAQTPASIEGAPEAPPPAAMPLGKSQYVDLAPPAPPDPTTPSVYDLLAGAPLVEHAPDAPESEAGAGFASHGEAPAPIADDPGATITVDPWQAVPLDVGRFALGGWAASAGHSMVSAVTFRRRLSEDISADRVILEIDASENVPGGGLVVLADPGFAPDRDGFTLLLTAADPGQFSATGSYRVLPAG